MRIPLDDLEVMKGKEEETAKFFNTIILTNATKKKKKSKIIPWLEIKFYFH